MWRVLKGKLRSLAYGEEGAAMAVTLALFMFMMLCCMAVLAVGESVKDRIHLQNACDSAAYSAAVVQADSLSRIATLNRAMSWTYVQTVRRQMDWVTYKWLDEACRHWRRDRDAARSWAESSVCSCSNPLHHGMHWYISDMELHGATAVNHHSEEYVSAKNAQFLSSHVGGDSSFYASLSSMEAQIEADWRTIAEIRRAVEEIERNYSALVERTAREVFEANVPPGDKAVFHVVFHPMEEYLEPLPGSRDDEERFLSFSRTSAAEAFGNSGNSWFERKGTTGGFRRGYRRGAEVLRAEWQWYSFRWDCHTGPFGSDIHLGPYPCGGCGHSHNRCQCAGTSFGHFWAVCHADNSSSIDAYYEMPLRYAARPVVLNEKYFGREGTITAVSAAENRNPFFRFLGDSVEGLYSAFNPFTRHTVCLSSAKAGYKFAVEPEEGREYRVDWKNAGWRDEGQSWNLCQNDFDAVLTPVRRAESPALDGEWTGDAADFIESYAGRVGAAGAGDALAGGEWTWQIGNPGAPLDWNALKRMMFH